MVKALLLAAVEKSEPLVRKLDSPSRAKLVMALLGLIVLGLGLVALVVMGGGYVRRLARHSAAKSRSHEDDWFRKPLLPRDEENPDDDSDDDTP